MDHYVRSTGMAPANCYSHAVAFSGPALGVSGQVPLDEEGQLVGQGDLQAFREVRDEFVRLDRPPASSLVQVSGLVNPEFRVEIEAIAAL